MTPRLARMLRRDPRRLPGTLADETPRPMIADGPVAARSRCATCAQPISWVGIDLPSGGFWSHANPSAVDHNAEPVHGPYVPASVASKWQPRDDAEYQQDAEPGPECTRCPELEARVRTLQLQLARHARITPPPADLRQVAELRAQLAETERERDEEAAINADLRKANSVLRGRVDGLELTLRAVATPATAPAPHDHGGDLLTPWPHDQP
jgi:hypothetical protein